MTNSTEHDIDLLLRILDYCDRIESCKQRFGDNFDIYQQDLDYQDVIKMNLFQIGECVNGISEECRNSIPSIPWHQIYGLRNVIAHGYVKIKEERIWQTIQNDIPLLQKEISNYFSLMGINSNN